MLRQCWDNVNTVKPEVLNSRWSGSFARGIEKVSVETERGWVRVDSLWDEQRETDKEHIEVTKNLKFGVNRAIIEQDIAF